MIFLRIRRVQADRNGINQSCKLRCDILAVNQAAKAVRIDPHRLMIVLLDISCSTKQHIKCLRRLSKPTEHDLLIVLHRRCIDLLQCFYELFIGRVMLQPQTVRFFHMIPRLTQAECTGTRTFIRQVDIQITMHLI